MRTNRIISALLVVMFFLCTILPVRVEAATYEMNVHSSGAGYINFTLNADSGGSIDVKYVAYGGDSSGESEGTADQIYAGGSYGTVGTDTVTAGSSSLFKMQNIYDSTSSYPNGYVLYFVKPQANHLLLSALSGSNTWHDYYPVDKLISDAASTSLRSYPHVADLAQKAKDEGYVMAFGFSRDNGNARATSQVTLRSTQPSLNVTATSDNTTSVGSGGTINVTVKITPEQMTNLAEGESVSINLTGLTLTVGGNAVSGYSQSGPDSNGTYTVTFSHTLTTDEWSNGTLNITATATSTYVYSFPASQVDSSGNRTGTGSVTTMSTVESSASISGRWNAEYTLIHNVNGGTGDIVNATEKGLGQVDIAVSSIVPTREDHAFLGWADEAGALTALYSAGSLVTVTGTEASNSRTIYAVWASSADNYILNYDANGGNGAPPSEAQENAAFTVSSTVPTRSDYVFEFWADNANGTGSLYKAGDSVTVTADESGNKTKTLYAIWAASTDVEKKQDVPTVEKKVWNNSSSAWQDTTFAGVNNLSSEANLIFKITGTMPSNLEGTITSESQSSGAKSNAFTDWDEDEDLEGDGSVVVGEDVQENAEGAESNVVNGTEELQSAAPGNNIPLIQEMSNEPLAAAEPAASNEGQSSGTPVYASYTDYKFTDTYEAGITPDVNTLKVYLYNGSDTTSEVAGMTGSSAGDGALDITSLFDVSHDSDNRTITVNIKRSGVEAIDGTTGAVDLKKSYTIDGNTASFHANSKIVVYFKATLNAQAQVGPTGNANKATLEFRNAKGEYLTEYTPPDTVRVFTFRLHVKKHKDSTTGDPLQGAEFKLYKTDKTNLVASGTSGSDGVISFNGLTTIATGTYILEETNSPLDGYNRMSDVTITISGTTEDPSVDPKLTAVNVTVSGDDATGSFSSDNTQVNVDVVNEAGSILPSTGGRGTRIFILLGGLLIAISTGVLMKRKVV